MLNDPLLLSGMTPRARRLAGVPGRALAAALLCLAVAPGTRLAAQQDAAPGPPPAATPSRPTDTPVPVAVAATWSRGAQRVAADALQAKLEDIVRFGAIPRLETQVTPLHEHEVNAYIWTYLMGDLPPGVTDPRVEIVGDSELRGSVVLDMDAYRAARPPTEGLDPLALLSGRLTARVRGRLTTTDGVGRFDLDAAELGGIPLPTALAQRLLTYYSRTADQPEGIRLDQPFDLPVSIREIRVEPRSAVVVQ